MSDDGCLFLERLDRRMGLSRSPGHSVYVFRQVSPYILQSEGKAAHIDNCQYPSGLGIFARYV